MTKLYYVGFNGYQQCPKNENQLPKVIEDWICIEDNDVLNVSCTHRVIAVEASESFKILGISGVNRYSPQFISKPATIECFAAGEEFLVAAEKIILWKLIYKDLQWSKIDFSFANKDEEKIWNESGNKILKFSLLKNEIFGLLNNGSVWKISEKNQLSLLFSYNIEKAVDITSGLEHSLILTESGCVLSMGNGSRGQLGNEDLNSFKQPVQISALEGLKIVKITTGGWHSCAITDSGDLYTWGWNNYGQLSAFDETEKVSLSTTPAFVDVGEDPNIKIVDVACGTRHTIAKLVEKTIITENGDIYSTGWNGYRQLGIGSCADKISKFTKANIQNEQGKLICGPWYSIISDDTKVITTTNSI